MTTPKNLIKILLVCFLSGRALSQSQTEDTQARLPQTQSNELQPNEQSSPEDSNQSKLSEANAYFSQKLYTQLTNNASNFVFSPLSISVALSMLSEGASGTTSHEINSTLGFAFAHLNEQELLQGYQNLVTSLTENRDGYEYSLANAQFIHNSFRVFENYTRILVDDFHAESRLVDFWNETEALRVINGWVSKETRGKIPQILKELAPQSVMALVNAVYFKGDWATKFEKTQTRNTDFFPAEGPRKEVEMMSEFMTARCKFHHELGDVLELPYKGQFFSMIFVMPSRGGSLTDVEERLTTQALLNITDNLHDMNITVGVPKLKFESSFDMISHLKSLGIHKVFTDQAELDGISSEPLKVGQAVHKATLEFNEEGAEASAATAVVTVTRNGGFRTHFWLNRPFMFMLRHNPTNTICFMGKVVDV